MSKLFRVLVAGGALLGAQAGCASDDPGGPDSKEVIADVDSGAVSGDAAELEDCGICPNEACCEYDEAGNGHEKEGLVCCWATSC